MNRVTRAEVATQWGESKADKITAALVRKHALRRVGRGIFLVVPLRAQARPTNPSAAASVAALLADEQYYLGGLWALTHHHLTLQQFTSRVDAFVVRRQHPRVLSHAHVQFHRVAPTRIAAGGQVTTIEDAPAQVSTPEQTVLDLLDYPDIAGSIGTAIALVTPALKHVELPKLLRLASGAARTSTCQRLGVMLERQGVARPRLAALRRRALTTQSLTSMVPSSPRRGRVNAQWRVVENDA